MYKNMKYITKNMYKYIHNLVHVEVLSENALNKLS